MIKRFVTALAFVAISSVAFAQFYDKPLNFNQKTALTPQNLPDPIAPNAEGDVVINISGIESWDGPGSLNNTLLSIDLLAENPLTTGVVTGIGWDTVQETVDPSWLSEMVIGFDWDCDGVEDLTLTPGAGDSFPGTAAYSSGGIIKLADAGIPDGVSPGKVCIEFYESFDDVTDAVDGVYLEPSFITLQLEKVPEPTSLALLGLAGLSLLGFRRR